MEERKNGRPWIFRTFSTFRYLTSSVSIPHTGCLFLMPLPCINSWPVLLFSCRESHLLHPFERCQYAPSNRREKRLLFLSDFMVGFSEFSKTFPICNQSRSLFHFSFSLWDMVMAKAFSEIQNFTTDCTSWATQFPSFLQIQSDFRWFLSISLWLLLQDSRWADVNVHLFHDQIFDTNPDAVSDVRSRGPDITLLIRQGWGSTLSSFASSKNLMTNHSCYSKP